MDNLRKNKMLWIVVALLAAAASAAGIFAPDIYNKVVSADLLPGAVGQDIITLAAAVLLLVVAFAAGKRKLRLQALFLGILGYFFYAYGIYVTERVYNVWYLVYMAVWALSFWGIIYGMVNLRKEALQKIKVPNFTRRFSIGVALLQPAVFYPLWIAALIPLMREGNKIEFLYSVYILDLCFVMPAFLIAAWMLYKKQAVGNIAIPALFILGFGIIFSLAVSEAVKPCFGAVPNMAGFWQSLALSALFLVAAIQHLYFLKKYE